MWEGLSGTASAEKEQDHPVRDRSQELGGMCDPEITLAGAPAPKDCCRISLYNAVHKAKKPTSSKVSLNESTTHSRRGHPLVCPWQREVASLMSQRPSVQV